MTMAISGARILSQRLWLDDHALLIDGGIITAICPSSGIPADSEVTRLDGGVLTAGFIDTQVNGGGGVLFNDAPCVETIATIAAAHRRYGTTAMLPTLISDDLEVISRAIIAVDAAILAGVPGIIGIHIEGPFLNADKRGIHNAAHFRALDDHAVAMVSALERGRTLVTLAPECVDEGTIAALVARGVIVAAGHSMASYEAMAHAVDEGLSGVTHLYNAMTQLEGRVPGVVGAALDMRLFSGIIVDGNHVHPAALRAAFRAKGPGELMLVTDAMPVVGTAMREFALGAQEIAMVDGALRARDGTLAGSALDMSSAVRNAVAMMGVTLVDACAMASAAPAHFLDLSVSHGDIAPGYRADIVHMDDSMHVQSVWIGGRPA